MSSTPARQEPNHQEEGKVKADIELQLLSSINRVFDRLQHGDVAARVVLEFASG